MSQRITIERDDIKFEALIPWDADMTMIMDAFRACLIGMTWTNDTIDDWVLREAERILIERHTGDNRYLLN